MSILNYIDVPTLSSINTAIEDTLTKTPFKIVRGVEKFAADVEEASDIPEFILNAMVTDFLYGYVDAFPGAVRKNNRILGTKGFCANTSVMFVTVRRVKYDTDHNKTTGAQFIPLYRKTWQGQGIAAGDGVSDAENTTDFWGSYEHPLTSSAKAIPEEVLGYDDYEGRPVTYERLETSRGRVHVWAKWKHSKACHDDKCGFDGGLANSGGYVAAIVLHKTTEHEARIGQMLKDGAEVAWNDIRDIATQMFVYLLDADSMPVAEPAIGSCGHGVRATQVLRLSDFFAIGAFDKYLTSTSVHFQTYNAATQVISEVELKWNMRQSGVVAAPFAVRTRSIKLDTRAGWLIIFEILYILGCAFYFVELFVYKMYKRGRQLFSDVWTYVNMLSIVSSIMSVAFRFQFGASNKSFLQDSAKYEVEHADLIAEIRAKNNVANLYQIFSAVALITIWLRVVELLAKTPPRVRLLETTLVKAFASVVAYFCYILVILAGFWAFVSVHFASFSLEFSNPGKAFISCFQLLCLNLLPYHTTQGAPLRVFFFFPYMFFSIISVQMFNSIINYAYNRTCDDMDVIFKRMAAEKKRQARFKKSGMRRIFRIVAKVCGWLKQKCCRMKDQDEDVQDTAPQPVDRNQELSQADKDIVEEHRADIIGKKNAHEKCLPMCLYGAFAICYILFLGISLQIEMNGNITSSISDLILNAPFEIMHATGSTHHRTFNEIRSLHDVDMWISKALPQIVFQGSSTWVASPHESTFYDSNTHCLQNWNCLVKGGNTSSPELVLKSIRVTERLFKQLTNHGTNDNDESDLPGTRFEFGGKVISTRGPNAVVGVTDKPGEHEDTTKPLDLFFEGRQFCSRHHSNGYMRIGGIVCLLDSDRSNMTKQLQIMRKQGFYSAQVASIVVDFVTYNPNTNSIVLVAMVFTALPSGGIEAFAGISAFSLLNVRTPSEDEGAFEVLLIFLENVFSFDMLCGLIYIVLVIYFMWSMIRNIYQETIKANFYDGTHWAVTVYEYFSGDIFHTLDLFSYIVSIISFSLFITWLTMQLSLDSKAGDDISEFLSFIEDLQARRRLYKLLSSCNLLSICVRPLKFFRNDPRMRKLNLTFSKAKMDIMWFNIMLIFFMAGFVLFAHIVFGVHKHELSGLLGSCVYLFKLLIGSFNFWELWVLSKFFSMLFVFGFIFLFKFFFLNIFFAILDKNFVTSDAPPMNARRVLKPVFGRLIRWIDWDADLNMEGEGTKVQKGAPPSRADRAHKYALQIAEARSQHNMKDDSGTVKKSKALNDVCDIDDRMNDVLRWSREEAKKFVEQFRKLQDEKQRATNDEMFLKQEVKAKYVDVEFNREREAMNEAERRNRYAMQVNEEIAKKDQEILAKYILRLEFKMDEKMKEYKGLNADVHHLSAEAQSMQLTREEIKQKSLPSNTDPKPGSLEPKPNPAPLALVAGNLASREDIAELVEEEEQKVVTQEEDESPQGVPSTGHLVEVLDGWMDT